MELIDRMGIFIGLTLVIAYLRFKIRVLVSYIWVMDRLYYLKCGEKLWEEGGEKQWN